MAASNTVFTVFSGFALVLSLIPLWWHLKSPNVGTCMFMVWAALACTVYFVDSIVWSGNTINRAPIWCDIAIRIQIGVGVALAACCLCIVRRVYYMTRIAPTAQIERRRGVIIDLLITVGIPVLQMALEYICASHRFNIIEDFGCSPTTWDTPLSYVLVWSWSLIIGVVSACYGVLTIREFMKRRKQSKDLISASFNLTYDRYWRLIALSSADLWITIPLSIRALVSDLTSKIYPWVSWDHIHSGYSHVFQVPRIVLNKYPGVVASYEITRWTPVFCAFFFFGIFGFTNEARTNYRLLGSTIAEFFGFTIFTRSESSPSSCATDCSLHFAPPVSVTLQTISGADSDSLSYKLSAVVNKFDFEDRSRSTVEQLTFTSSTNFSIDEVPRFPEPVLDPMLVRRPFALDDSIPVHPGNTLDRV